MNDIAKGWTEELNITQKNRVTINQVALDIMAVGLYHAL